MSYNGCGLIVNNITVTITAGTYPRIVQYPLLFHVGLHTRHLSVLNPLLEDKFLKTTNELSKSKSSMISTFLFWNPVQCFQELANTSLVCTYRFPVFLLEILYQLLHNLKRRMIERMNCTISFLKCNGILVCKENVFSVAEQH